MAYKEEETISQFFITSYQLLLDERMGVCTACYVESNNFISIKSMYCCYYMYIFFAVYFHNNIEDQSHTKMYRVRIDSVLSFDTCDLRPLEV